MALPLRGLSLRPKKVYIQCDKYSGEVWWNGVGAKRGPLERKMLELMLKEERLDRRNKGLN